MIWVKLCGMRTADDVDAAARAGADAIGLVTARRSVRRLTVGQAAQLARSSDIPSYLVTEDLEPPEVLRQAQETGVTGIQPHGLYGRQAAVTGLEAGLEVLFPVGPEDDLAVVPEGAIPIVDGPVPGTGAELVWSTLGFGSRFVLAGGLTPENVAEAVAASGAYGVDVSSGIESEPGVKDHDLMRRFVAAVR